MSNKNPEKTEKMDGVFETASADKPEVNTGKPARLPKARWSMGRETKVGLAVIAALLVIFVIVLVIRLRGEGDEEVAKKDAAAAKKVVNAKDAGGEKKKDASQKNATMLSPENGSSKGGYWDQPLSVGTNSKSQNGFGSPPAVNGNQPPEPGYGNRVGFPAGQAAGAHTANAQAAENGIAPAGSQPGSAYPTSDPARTGMDPFGARTSMGSANAAPITGSGFAPDDAAAPDMRFPAGSAPATELNAKQPGLQGPAGQPPAGDDPAATGAKSASKGNSPYDGNGGSAIGFDANLARELAPELAGATEDRSIEQQNTAEPSGVNSFGKRDAPGARITGELNANTFEVSPADDSKPLAPVEEFRAGADAGLLSRTNEADLNAVPAESRLKFGNRTGKVAEAAAMEESPPAAQKGMQVGAANPPALLENADAAQGDELYVVKASDSYWEIAKRAYGSGAYFKALCEHNRRNGGVTLLEPGVQLRLPDEATLQRLYPTLCPPPARLAVAPAARTASANVGADGPTYEVQAGDTLYEIAHRQLGKGARFSQIYALNRDLIGRPTDRLEPGMRLRLPASGE